VDTTKEPYSCRYGAGFTIRPLASNGVHITCRDLHSNAFTEGGSMEFILDQIPELDQPEGLLEHKR